MPTTRHKKYVRPLIAPSRAYALWREYHLTVDDFLNQHKHQEGRCGICGGYPDKLEVDHCHRTGKVRGLLCRSCNWRLGQVENGHRYPTPEEDVYLAAPSPFPEGIGIVDRQESTWVTLDEIHNMTYRKRDVQPVRMVGSRLSPPEPRRGPRDKPVKIPRVRATPPDSTYC